MTRRLNLSSGVKWCGGCGRERVLAEFARRSDRPNGYQSRSHHSIPSRALTLDGARHSVGPWASARMASTRAAVSTWS